MARLVPPKTGLQPCPHPGPAIDDHRRGAGPALAILEESLGEIERG
jgi:hypothetical protein